MLKNYIKTAIRNLARHKSNAVINIAGLTVGFAAFLLIFLVVQYEQSFDSFHAKKDRIYRVVRVSRDLVKPSYRTGVPMPVTSTLRAELPQLTNTAAISNASDVQVIIPAKDGSAIKRFKEASGVFFAEPQFFQMFNFGLAAGDIKTAVSEPNTVLLTKDIASKYFGSWRTAIGKILKMDGNNVKVTGVLNNPPSNTDFPIKAVLSYITITNNQNAKNWSGIDDGNYCFVELADGHTQTQLAQLLTDFTNRHIKPINPSYILSPQPLNEMHYDERYGNFTGRTFSKDLTLALNLIGLFLLIVACVNFVNLTVAQAVNRAREVGVRKVLGGNRLQLIAQFLGETIITSFFALLIALIIVVFTIPALNNLLEINLSLSMLYNIRIILFMFGALIMVSLLSGLYPALVLSGFKPAAVLKGAAGGDQKRGVLFRRGLVVFQFVIAQVLIIGTLIVTSQMDYFRNADMGFRKDAIIYASFPGDSLSRTKTDYLRDQLLKISGVEKISFSMFSPSTNGEGWYFDLRTPGNKSINPDMVVSMKMADPGFFSVYSLPIVAGRAYFPSDTMREYVVNETVIRKLGIQSPKDAIGKLINVGGRTFPIVGVVKDFHDNSLRDPIIPIVMTTRKNGYGLANIKIGLSKTKAITAAMESLWNRNFPEFTFEYKFMDQTVANFYKQENQLSQLYTIFSGIAIFISCLGLYGLISFMAIQRKKEIGIRKVLGAPVKDIVVLLSKEFTMLVIIAFFIASPLAWYFMHQWLQGYTYHIIIGLGFFAATILSSICIAWLTVGYTAIKAALTNPVNSLRTE
ncbi:duplicated orphan permease [Mucilaginibacter sp. OK268]|uniref:ABC transporter permease n=1 Tax=Mucilaginibacter sp. OK268 TaxID=1881048 RepID=UPI00087FCC17|nr:ABC transporter permease [Mucilaginibacter sp. OK268]SDP50263.1 duplicated orphan permease [Mucilaginibacter sp. OK268]